ncbi:extracellular solute-binding protein [Lachnobacterium bovis]|uniref:Arabinogalactan oligomer / maltooligosaccharide transport system substrate-binding protein n=1 Tax=Lachnobacterium bovis TaxID=140626 RepID=A0A1H9SPQ8_9FIRM|nr:extracellular solute-binding protein [Lachnobacterium bovis]SER86329.1 arabinogalactan oligomer / maltooligosaccharide transport system substrate-binding protein [Lachnobacterium bovis]
MKRKVLPLVLAGTMATTMFAGCGTTEEKKADGKDTITLTVMGPAEDQSKDNGEWLQTQCKNFAKEHKEWNIKFKYQKTSEGDAKQVVTKDVSSAADVYMFANDQLVDLVKAGGLAKLGGETEKYVKESNDENIANSVKYEGHYYGIPYTPNAFFMYYDKRKFSEEDVKSLDKMLEKGKVSFPLTNGWYISAMYTANGCTFYGKDGATKKDKIDFSEEKAAPVTKKLVELVKNPNFVVVGDDGDSVTGLKNGVSAIFDGNWNYDKVAEALGGEENVGTAVLPTINIDGQEKQMKGFLGSKAIGVNPKCKNQEVAVALAKYLGSEKSQKAHFETRKQAPVNKNLTTDKEILGNSAVSALVQVGEKSTVVQPLFGLQGYWDAATPFGKAILNKEITDGNYKEKTAEFNKQINGSVVK